MYMCAVGAPCIEGFRLIMLFSIFICVFLSRVSVCVYLCLCTCTRVNVHCNIVERKVDGRRSYWRQEFKSSEKRLNHLLEPGVGQNTVFE